MIVERLLGLLTEDDLDAWRARYSEEDQLTLDYWLNVNRFDRREVNRRLEQYTAGDEAWRRQWEEVVLR